LNKNIRTQEIDHQWCIAEEKFSIDTNKHFEGLFTQGNGYMHIRGSFEEGLESTVQDEEYLRMPVNVTLEKPRHPKTKWGTFIPGIVGIHPLLKMEMINLPYFLELDFCVMGEKLDMEQCKIREYKRWLDLRDGCLHRGFIWETKAGLHLKLQYLRFISMADKHLSIQQVHIQALSGEGNLAMDGGINWGVRTNGYNHFKAVRTAVDDATFISAETITDGGNRVLMISSMEASEEIFADKVTDSKKVMYHGNKPMKAGDYFTIQKVTSVVTDRDNEAGFLEERGKNYLAVVQEQGYEKLYERHLQAWTEKWRASDIKITGDDKVQLAMRASIYHLIRSNCENDSRVAICAKGYAGEAYFGRYFWDTEINMLPFFLHTNPEAARNLILFRYNTLEGAKKNARAYGYEGARYAWESSITGEEQCPCWQYGDHEVHITADIIYAMVHYVNGTGDMDFIRDYGIDMMVETARYWVQRVDWNKEGYYELLGVMGPDEYLPMTRNNVYTNRMVKFSLSKTIEYLEILRNENEIGYLELKHRLGLNSHEIEKFEEVKEKLKISYDESSEIIFQSDDFKSYADLDFNTIWKDRTKPFGDFISQEKNYRSKALKQADVLEMILLYPQDFTSQQLSHNYDYYEPITTHDSSLSAAVHGILAAWMGRMEEAEKFLEKVVAIDMSLEKKGAAEGIHIANCGGLWQMVVYGFAGLKSAMWESEIKLEPHLPGTWEKVEIPIMWHGKQYRLIVTKDSYEVREES
jgi:kojibiose phosphorylase